MAHKVRYWRVELNPRCNCAHSAPGRRKQTLKATFHSSRISKSWFELSIFSDATFWAFAGRPSQGSVTQGISVVRKFLPFLRPEIHSPCLKINSNSGLRIPEIKRSSGTARTTQRTPCHSSSGFSISCGGFREMSSNR
jgi:hypothetical protein